ncbi:MAG: hypothetical protein A3F74_11110 [Betaproteobacteria bacterium RIFCSPLOWO2_12_FULL_62_58]|nr:MAG: hypothetical protein A3F74_11110 [Betaproteobacteria bacterium RIFCSPLOWO2_12_FULL_62_58]
MLRLAAILVLSWCGTPYAAPPDYPTKPVRLVVVYPPINRQVNEALQARDVQRQLAEQGSEPVGPYAVDEGLVNASGDSVWRAVRGGFYRTQRRLFEGHLLVRASALH